MGRISIAATIIAATLCSLPATAGDDPGCQLSFGDHPANGAMGVPTNPIVFSAAYSSYDDGNCDTFDEEFVPPTIVPSEGGGDPIATTAVITIHEEYCCKLVAFRPDEELEPLTEYSLEWGEAGTLFTTSAGPDNDIPVLAEDPADPCAITYLEAEQIVLAVSHYSQDIAHGVIIDSPDGAIDGCHQYPWEVFDAAGNSVEAGGNAVAEDAESDSGCVVSGAGRPLPPSLLAWLFSFLF